MVLLMGIVLALHPSQGLAQEEEPAKKTPPPDYSRKALLTIFSDFYVVEDEEENGYPLQWPLEIGRTRYRLRFLPIMMPMVGTVAQGGNPLPMINPFTQLGLDFPFVSRGGGEAMSERDFQRALRRLERRKERERRERD